MVVMPKTSPKLAMFEPKTLLIAIDVAPLNAAFKLTNSSGNEVVKDTTVNPIIILDNFNLEDNATETRTRYSPPISKKIKPIIKSRISTTIFFN